MRRTQNTGHMTDCFHGHYGEVKPGDTIILDYGCGNGSDIGKAYGKSADQLNRQIRVKMADGNFEYVHGFTGIVGNYKGVGAYWMPDSPLRNK